MRVRNKKGWLFKIAEQRHILLPKYSSKCITKEYLLNLLKSNIFYVLSEQVSHAVLMDLTITKENLFKLLEKAIKTVDPNIISGFDNKHLPNF